jgi:HEAT repeat protein
MRKAFGALVLAAVGLGAAYVVWQRSAGVDAGTKEKQPARRPAASAAGVARVETPPAQPAAVAVSTPLSPPEAAVAALLAIADPEAVDPALWKFLENTDSNTVAALAKALETEKDLMRLERIGRALIGIGTEESFRVFRDFLSRKENVSHCEHLAGTLMELRNEELSGEVLDWMMGTGNYDVAMACREAAGRLATAETIAQIIAEHSRTNYNDYMLGLMRTALENSECPEALDLLRGVLENPLGRPTLAVQAAAARALANIGTKPAIDALVAALEKSPRNSTNDFLVEAVAGLHDSYNQAYLQEIFDRTTSPGVKYALGLALAQTLDTYVDPAEAELISMEDHAAPEAALPEGGSTNAPAAENAVIDTGSSPSDAVDDSFIPGKGGLPPPAEARVD